jgi:hypothetical protein
LEHKYQAQINAIKDNDPSGKIKDILLSCSKEYCQGVKGNNNLHHINALLQKLLEVSFKKIKSQLQFAH